MCACPCECLCVLYKSRKKLAYGRGKVNCIHLRVNDSRGAKRVLWEKRVLWN